MPSRSDDIISPGFVHSFFLLSSLTRISPVFVFFSFSLCSSSLPCISGMMLDSDWGWGTTRHATLPLDWTALTLSLPTNQWRMTALSSTLLTNYDLNLLTICFSQNVFGIMNLNLSYWKHVAAVLCWVFSLPMFLSPNVPPLPLFCVLPLFFFQSPR